VRRDRRESGTDVDPAVAIARVVLSDDRVDIEVGGILDVPPSDHTERQREFPRVVVVSVLVLSAEPPRPAVGEIERVALAIGRADGDVGDAVDVPRLESPAGDVISAHREHRRSRRKAWKGVVPAYASVETDSIKSRIVTTSVATSRPRRGRLLFVW